MKMNQFVNLLIIFLIVQFVNCAKYPADWERCKNSDETCFNKVISEVIGASHKGDPKINLVSIDPLHIKTLIISQDPNSPVNVQLKFSEVDLIGIGTAKVYKTVGFDKDPRNSLFEISLKIPQLSIVGPYEIKGNVLILPITGKGQSNMTFENMDIFVKLHTKVDNRKGKDYLNMEKVTLSFTVTRMYFHLENLFNGDQALGDNMNRFLNENWQDIFDEVKDGIFKAIGEVLKHVINGPFTKIPYKNLFLD